MGNGPSVVAVRATGMIVFTQLGGGPRGARKLLLMTARWTVLFKDMEICVKR